METKTQSFSKKLLSLVFAVMFSLSAFLPMFEASAATVKLSRKNITVAVGQTYSLKISGATGSVKWKTSNKNVATVSKSGVVKGIKRGSATVTATVGQKNYNCKVTVDSPKLSATKKSVKAGASFTLKLTGTSRKVRWRSSDTSVARVSQSGVVKTYSAGSAYIFATVGKKRCVCKVTVTAASSSSGGYNNNGGFKYFSPTGYIPQKGGKKNPGKSSSLRKSKYAISRSSARARGYEPCKRCRP